MAYHLDVVCRPSVAPPSNGASRTAPHKISGNKDVGFFSIARMKDRTLLFYKKGGVSSSTFKVITVRHSCQPPSDVAHSGPRARARARDRTPLALPAAAQRADR